MEISFANKRVLVTGAGLGIGKGIAKKLVECGAKVTALSKIEEELTAFKAEEPRIRTVTADITSSDIRRVLREAGPFDYLVNNAGIGGCFHSFLDITEEEWDEVYKVNLRAMFIVSQEVAKMMVENKIKGSIVNISSVASKIALKNHTVYGSAKTAVDMLTKVMALELGDYGIRVNSINPIAVLTALGRINWENPAKAEPILKRAPLHRFAEVEDVVNAVVFMLSDKASMISAVNLLVDGGFSAV